MRADESHRSTEGPSEAAGISESPSAPASADSSADDSGSESASAEEDDDGPMLDPDSTLYKTVKYTGKFHLMALHFPIAFLLAAALAQWYRLASGKGGSVVAAMLWFGTLGAVAAASLGWMYAYDSVYFGDDEQVLFWHRWLGTGTAVLALLVLLTHKLLGPKSLAVALTVCAALVGVAAHFGASLVYGVDFLKEF